VEASDIFSQDFLTALQNFIRHHHVIYKAIPPKGIYFECLVEEAFKQVRLPFTPVKTTIRNLPTHDLVMGDVRLSLKTETGYSTNPNFIQITKLCTTEKGPWTADTKFALTCNKLCFIISPLNHSRGDCHGQAEKGD
jgi:hypothetical protein